MSDNLLEVFHQLRRYIEHDLDQLLEQPEGGNYAAVLLIVIGCEALSRLLGKPIDSIFIEKLMKPYGLNDAMAQDVADALRNGLAHIYDTKYIEAGNLKFELVVSWGKMKHLSINRDSPGLFLNVRTMRDDLRNEFEEIARQLEINNSKTLNVSAEWKKKRTKQSHKSVKEWKKKFEIK